MSTKMQTLETIGRNMHTHTKIIKPPKNHQVIPKSRHNETKCPDHNEQTRN